MPSCLGPHWTHPAVLCGIQAGERPHFPWPLPEVHRRAGVTHGWLMDLQWELFSCFWLQLQ